MTRTHLIQLQEVPDEYICAAKLAEASGHSLRWAQTIINRAPDRYKVRVGRTIYAHGGVLVLRWRRGNPLLKSSYYQHCIAMCKWYPERRQEMRVNLARHAAYERNK